MTSITTTKTRELNDAFRRAGPSGADWFLTAGVHDEGAEFVIMATRSVMTFTGFDADNDPYGEHDFGAFALGERKLFWKIDYYDRSLTYGSDDPANPAITRRVMTIMLASDY